MDRAMTIAGIANRLASPCCTGAPPTRHPGAFPRSARAAETLALESAGMVTSLGQPDALMIVGVQLFAIRGEQGRLAELIEILEQRVAESPGLPTLQATLAFAYSELGRMDEAKAIFDRAAAATSPRFRLTSAGSTV